MTSPSPKNSVNPVVSIKCGDIYEAAKLGHLEALKQFLAGNDLDVDDVDSVSDGAARCSAPPPHAPSHSFIPQMCKLQRLI